MTRSISSAHDAHPKHRQMAAAVKAAAAPTLAPIVSASPPAAVPQAAASTAAQKSGETSIPIKTSSAGEAAAAPDHLAGPEFADVDAAIRRSMIETEAYYLAETRCFAPGHELDDWCQAERAVDERLSASLSAIESSLRSATALLER